SPDGLSRGEAPYLISRRHREGFGRSSAGRVAERTTPGGLRCDLAPKEGYRMDAPTDRLVRALSPAALTLRDATENDDDPGDGRLATLDVNFARFNVWNEIDSWFEGRFLERVAPGAFRKTMKE